MAKGDGTARQRVSGNIAGTVAIGDRDSSGCIAGTASGLGQQGYGIYQEVDFRKEREAAR